MDIWEHFGESADDRTNTPAKMSHTILCVDISKSISEFTQSNDEEP